MQVFTKGAELSAALRKEKVLTGFVPTMGALHQGHASLVERCRRECERVVVSVFVNPTQFNDPADLRSYPRTLDADLKLLEAANMIPGEKVQVVNVNNGERLETYIIKGERGSGAVCLNGPAARKCVVGDVVIIISYALLDFEEAKSFKPWVVFPDTATNRLVK